MLIIQKFNAIQNKVSFVDSLLVVTDGRHGTNFVDGCLYLKCVYITISKTAPAKRHLPV